jgi:hypothetical protein
MPLNPETAMTRTIAILAAAGAAAAARADGISYWLADVTTDDGDALVEPGETASVTLTMLMETYPGDGPFAAFCAAIFDVLGDDGAAGGHILGWEYHNSLNELTGDLATTDGVSIYFVNTGQLTTFGPFASDNPIDVFTFHWAPDEYTPFEATYTTDTDYEGNRSMLVWEGEDKETAHAVEYPVVEAGITITVVPAPISAAPLLLLTRRRRAPNHDRQRGDLARRTHTKPLTTAAP